MSPVTISLAAISLSVLVLGLYVWRLTSSRPALLNILLSSAFLLLAGYAVTDPQKKDFGFALAFFAAMLCTGRAAAYLWRGRKEEILRFPGRLMAFLSVLTIIGTIIAYRARL